MAAIQAAAADGLYIGLMSGTSLDGVDAVLADFGPASTPNLLAHRHAAFSVDLRQQLLALCASGPDEIERGGSAALELARLYAQLVDQLINDCGIAPTKVRAIGAHGQTIRHRPRAGFSVQLNAPALLAELAGIDVIADFRSRDIAAGGQGAPLVAGFHAAVFGVAEPRAVVNIGGISNLTALPAAGAGTIIGFDCGPGNVLIDAWTQKHFDRAYDHDGELAAAGRIDPHLLEALLAEPYFSAPPPKSTGRELFTLDWVQQKSEAPPDHRTVLATLTRLTARAIADAIKRWAPEAADVVVCGGGAGNRTLMRALAEECAPRAVRTSGEFGVEPHHVEALAFAWLAQRHVAGKAGNVPGVTGAAGMRVLGARYPGRGV